jgi:CheY-like chemotaxis protein
VRRMLQGQGFVVREARDGESALRLWYAERDQIIAVMTDVVMPVMGGRDLARELRLLDPALPILFVSAYAGHEPDLLDGVDAPRQVLGKPFTNESLLSALRALLGGTT